MPRIHPVWLLSLSVFIPSSGLAAPTAPPSAAESSQDSKRQCASAFEAAQRLRRDGKLKDSREQAIACSQQQCPEFLRTRCEPWLAEIDAALPSVVVEARDREGKETTAVKLWVDGELASEKADGRSVGIDPGEHLLRVTLGDDGIEVRVVLREGERARRIEADFSKLVRRAQPAPSAVQPAVTASPPPPRSAPPVASYVLGGVGVIGLAAFAGFALSGKSKQNDLESTCAPRCSPDDIQSMRTRYLVADIALGAGLVSLGAAGWLYFGRREAKETSVASVSVSPLPGGGQLGISGAF